MTPIPAGLPAFGITIFKPVVVQVIPGPHERSTIVELVNMIIQQLGVSEEQAKGGAGALFSLAQQKLGSTDFGKVSEVVPQVQELMDAAPQAGLVGNVLGNLTSSMGGGAEGLGGLAKLAGQFSKLDLDADAIGKFVPIVLSFVQSKGGDGLKDLLAGVLK